MLIVRSVHKKQNSWREKCGLRGELFICIFLNLYFFLRFKHCAQELDTIDPPKCEELAVAYKRLKTREHYNIVSPKSGRGRLRSHHLLEILMGKILVFWIGCRSWRFDGILKGSGKIYQCFRLFTDNKQAHEWNRAITLRRSEGKIVWLKSPALLT